MKEIRELGGEVRRLHIIYFVTHMDMGRIEHPHLIRVRRLNAANGVYLRDVKRWLAELRGKEMPDAFAWSYKRRYRSGYIWQDLVDDDLITPISDDEYVLKGSEITPPSSSSANYHFGPTGINELVIDDQKEQRYAITPPQLGPQETAAMATCQNSSSIDSLTTFKSSSSKSRMRKNINSRSGSSSKASLIRNFITCRAEDANEQVIIMSKQPRNVDNNTCKQPQHTRTREFATSKTVSVVYKPVGGPTCSQCGKLFKPEKMHTHMKSCKGMKALAN